ncbi:hypothetical membrane protein [Corynebacterium renale]|uniref:PrsW family intramembrane metalloprotease n=1 Tax=Corynebacterium renale TaxID=1724 RepID=UPI000DA3478C|nr:PrsW family intramembrane metalloprotease [Corynebacterium renale]SQG63769.1 hypothetical membrane protein [Corynebacterium renale]STD02083.1 hypothetical membrane protein [Corynebacterium renale]
MSRLFRITLWVLLAVGIGMTVFQLLGLMIIDPAMAVLNIVIGGAYLALVLFLLSRLPFWPRGTAWVASALLWGGGTTMIFVFASTPAINLVDTLLPEAVIFSFGGAYPEEIGKAVGILVILLSFRQLNRPWHGLAVGMSVGLGFEVFENIQYGLFGALMDPNSDLIGVAQMWGARVVAGPLLHVAFCALSGWGIGLALYKADWSAWKRLGVAAAGLGAAFLLHFWWNFSPGTDLAYVISLVTCALVLYPAVIWCCVDASRRSHADNSYAYTAVGA